MKTFSGAVGTALAGAALFASSVRADASSIDPIVINGKHFFYNTNHTEFFLRGVAYQQNYQANVTAQSNATYTDPLADTAACMRDIPYLVALRTNVIRTYAVDPTQDHSGCMNALANAGIYVISDLSTPSQSIISDNPEWTTDLFTRYAAVIKDLAQYNNVIGFFAGNEVSNSANTTAASAFVKAAVRDTKYYISQEIDRPVYVGYATYDGDIRDQLAQYYNCGDQSAAIDFWGYNVYSWCGNSSYTLSGYDERTEFFEDYSVPTFFAEYGCNEVEPRTFTEVKALYGPMMAPVWSGGIVYMYFQEENNYGLVSVSGNKVTTNQDYDNLSSQMASVTPSSTAYSAINSGTPTTCPTVGASWSATSSPLPPRPNSDLCDCIVDTLGCVVNPSTDLDDYGANFNFICGVPGTSYCDGIQHNATTGTYGAYSMCSPAQQLSFVMNQYYQDQQSKNQPSGCDFSGAGQTQAAASATGSCQSLVQAAGTDGAGTVPSSLSTGSTTGTNAAGAVSIPGFDRTILYIGLYILGAAATGAGMLIL